MTTKCCAHHRRGKGDALRRPRTNIVPWDRWFECPCLATATPLGKPPYSRQTSYASTIWEQAHPAHRSEFLWARQPAAMYQGFKRYLTSKTGNRAASCGTHIIIVQRTLNTTRRLKRMTSVMLSEQIEEVLASVPNQTRIFRPYVRTVEFGFRSSHGTNPHLQLCADRHRSTRRLLNILFVRRGSHLIELGDVTYPCYKNLADRMGIHYYHLEPKAQSQLPKLIVNALRYASLERSLSPALRALCAA